MEFAHWRSGYKINNSQKLDISYPIDQEAIKTISHEIGYELALGGRYQHYGAWLVKEVGVIPVNPIHTYTYTHTYIHTYIYTNTWIWILWKGFGGESFLLDFYDATLIICYIKVD